MALANGFTVQLTNTPEPLSPVSIPCVEVLVQARPALSGQATGNTGQVSIGTAMSFGIVLPTTTAPATTTSGGATTGASGATTTAPGTTTGTPVPQGYKLNPGDHQVFGVSDVSELWAMSTAASGDTLFVWPRVNYD